MLESDVVELVRRLPGVQAVTPGPGSEAPEIAWGDTFFFYDPAGVGGAAQRMPFATIVTKDYGDFDDASDLDRPGVFRVSIGVGRATFEELFGHPPAAAADHLAEHDLTELDRLVPHPVYSAQGWVCVLNPGPRTSSQVEVLLAEAHRRAAEHYRRRGLGD